MKIIAFDLGKRRTGVALYDGSVGLAIPLDPIVSDGDPATLATSLHAKAKERGVTHVAIGIPLLPSGMEGEQSHWVHRVIAAFKERSSLPVFTIDERYTSYGSLSSAHANDKAACAIAEQAAATVARGKST